MSAANEHSTSPPPPLRVVIDASSEETRELLFERAFRIGRTGDAEVCIKDEHVSRNHAEVRFENGQWWICDLNSSNGVFIAGERVSLAAIAETTQVRLGKFGPVVSLEVEQPRETEMARYIDHYFGKSAADDAAGDHTLFVRKALRKCKRNRDGNMPKS